LQSQIVLSVGQLILRKRHHILIDAVAQLHPEFPGLRVFIIGEGALRSSLENKVSALGLERHVSFIGAVKNEELFQWYSAADVTCLASSREGFPCVLLESLACGTPVVATQIEGTREVVGSRDLGLLVGQDAIAIAEGLADALRLRWSHLAFAPYVQSLTWTQIGNAIDEILVSAVHTRERFKSLALKATMQ
jgi:glycosyltransferase involved in cell wall biosynthesis